MITIRLLLTIIGSILWFIGPVFTRDTPSQPGVRLYTEKEDGFVRIAKDVIRNAIPELLQIFGIICIVIALLWDKEVPWWFIMYVSFILLVILWFFRTLSYFSKWCKPRNTAFNNKISPRGHPKILEGLKRFLHFYLCYKNISKSSYHNK